MSLLLGLMIGAGEISFFVGFVLEIYSFNQEYTVRIDKAIKIYNKSKRKPVIIPSGGQGQDETISEAEAMKKYLLSMVEHLLPGIIGPVL